MNADLNDDKPENNVPPGKGQPATQDEGLPAEEFVLGLAPDPVSPPIGGPSAASSDQPAAWYTARRDGQRAGPFSLPALKKQFAAGELSPGDLVWMVGMPNWMPAGEVPELAGGAGNLGGVPRRPGGAAEPAPVRPASPAHGGVVPQRPGGVSDPAPVRPASPARSGDAPQRPGGVSDRSDDLLRNFNNILSNAAFYRISGLISLGLALITLLMSMVLAYWQLTWFTGAVLFLAIGLGGQAAGHVLDLLHRIDAQLQERAK
jgi:hypothetical protein